MDISNTHIFLSNKIESHFARLVKKLQSYTKDHVIIAPDGGLVWYLWQEITRMIEAPLFHVEILPLQQWLERNTIHTILSSKREFHFFGFASMSHEWLRQCIGQSHIHFYFLSPSMMFWTDVYTDKELRKIQLPDVDEEVLHSLYWDRHPLLANNGALARQTIQAIQETDAPIEEEYLIPESIRSHSFYNEVIRHEVSNTSFSLKKATFLQMVQADLLTLSYRREEKIEVVDDQSLQVRTSRTLLEEVELLYEVLMRQALCINLTEQLLPAACIVYVDGLDRYLPYIERVFGKKDSALSYEVVGHKNPMHAATLAGSFFHSLACVSKRVSKNDILTLLNSQFLKTFQFSTDEILTIKAYFEKSPFFEGVHMRSLEKELERSGILFSQGARTWEDLTRDMVCASTQRESPGIELEVATAQAVGHFISIVQQLFSEFGGYLSEEKNGAVWAAIFDKHLNTYFWQSEDRKERMWLEDAIAAFSTSQEFLCFEAACEQLQKKYEEMQRREKLFFQKPVVFTPVGELRGLPARVIAYIGMNEKKDLLQPSVSCSAAQQFQIPRYGKMQDVQQLHFIESIHLAQDAFYVSYQAEECCAEPLLPVRNLLQAMNAGFAWGNSPSEEKEHAAIPISEKEMQHASCVVKTKKVQKNIDIRLLCDIARNPIKAYLQKSLGIYLKKDEAEDNFWMSTQLEWSSKREALQLDHAQFIEKIESSPEMPMGHLKKVAIASLSRDKSEIEAVKGKLNIPSSLQIIELMTNCHQQEWITEERLLAPSIPLKIEGKDYFLIGEIGPVCKTGLVTFDRLYTHSFYSNYPLLSILSILDKETSIYGIRDAKKLHFHIEEPLQKLHDFVAYALEALEAPSLLMPEWIEEIAITDSAAHFLQKISRKNEWVDPYIGYFFKTDHLSYFEKQWGHWRKMADLFVKARK